MPVFADIYDQVIFVLKNIGNANNKIKRELSKNKNLAIISQALG
jgi:hypothetical protein